MYKRSQLEVCQTKEVIVLLVQHRVRVKFLLVVLPTGCIMSSMRKCHSFDREGASTSTIGSVPREHTIGVFLTTPATGSTPSGTTA